MIAPVAWSESWWTKECSPPVWTFTLCFPMLEKEHGRVGQKVRNSPGSHAGVGRKESEQGPVDSGVGTVSHGNGGAENWGGGPQRQRELCGGRSHLFWIYCPFSTWDSDWDTVSAGEIFVRWTMNTLKKKNTLFFKSLSWLASRTFPLHPSGCQDDWKLKYVTLWLEGARKNGNMSPQGHHRGQEQDGTFKLQWGGDQCADT